MIQRGEHGLLIPTPGIQVARVAPATLADYKDKVLSYSPIGYWMLDETSGSTATDSSGNGYDGSYVGSPTLDQTGIGDGRGAPLFDGTNDAVNVYTTGFRDAWDGAEGSEIVWGKVSGAGVWTDSTERWISLFGVDTSQNFVKALKTTVDNKILMDREGNNVGGFINPTMSPTTWFMLSVSWSETADEVKFYIDGTQSGSTKTSIGTWAGSLAALGCVLAAKSPTPAKPWDGYVAHAAVFTTVLSGTDMSDLASV